MSVLFLPLLFACGDPVDEKVPPAPQLKASVRGGKGGAAKMAKSKGNWAKAKARMQRPVDKFDLKGGRDALAYAPKKRKADAPLLIALHGKGGAPEHMRAITGFDEIADREGFVVVYGRAADPVWTWWLVKPDDPLPTHDEVGYLRGIIKEADKRYDIDHSRIYIAAFSVGGFMAQAAACMMPDTFAGVVAVGANWARKKVNCKTGPTPVLFIQGTEDEANLIDGNDPTRKGNGSTRDAVRFWKGINNCATGKTQVSKLPDRAPGDGTRVVREAEPDCATPVELLVVEGGGHRWCGGGPGADKPNNRSTRDIDSNYIWDFLKKHRTKGKGKAKSKGKGKR